MPYLSTAGAVRPGLGADRLGIGVPGYAHPLLAPVEWAELLRFSRLHAPGTGLTAPLHWTVLNVADGPGARPDPHCLEASGRLRNAGLRVLGHLDMTYGARAYDELVQDARRFLDWYRVDGFYLDRCPADRDELPATRKLTAALRSMLDGAGSGDAQGGARVVLGHGTHPYAGYAEAADQLVTFSGPWTDYRWSQAAEWTAAHPASRFCHLVHGVPRTHLEEALRIARWQGAGTIWFTDRTDRDRTGDQVGSAWEALPGYWDEIVSRIGPGVSE
ncbi:spherulation-specific family 4 protein [Streptomyces sp. NPDC091272]|uniref:spherulation-specific family 4 protein n=1 Tax=Streptomyces sp. NPDC091272 TaxID=3365981 RepID=UPI00382AEFF0